MQSNECYTYFKIVGDFRHEEITEILGIKPAVAWNVGDRRRNGSKYNFAMWHTERCTDNMLDITEQMRQVIEPLLPKVELLRGIKDRMNVDFYIEIVPEIHDKHAILPAIFVSSDIIDFCHATTTEIDVDMYIY